MKRLLSLSATALLVFAVAAYPAGKTVGEENFAFTKMAAPFENQSSLWKAKFDDGSFFYAHIFNYKFTVYEKWGATAVLVDPDGKRHIATVEIDPKKIIYSRDSMDFKGENASQSGRWPDYKFSMKSPKLSFDLAYKCLAKPIVPGDAGKTYYDAEKKIFLKNVSHCPWAEVVGTFDIDGGKRPVSGQGYADRDHANQLFTKQIGQLHSYRAWPADPATGYSICFIEYIGGPQYKDVRAKWMALMKKGETTMMTETFEFRPLKLKKDEATGFEYPESWSFSAKSGSMSLTGNWTKKKTIDVLDVINEIPSPLRPIARRFFTRPVFYRMAGGFEGVFENGAVKIPIRVDGIYKAVYTK